MRSAVFLEDVVGAEGVDILLILLSNEGEQCELWDPLDFTVLMRRPSISKMHARTGGKLQGVSVYMLKCNQRNSYFSSFSHAIFNFRHSFRF
jgi:hypothetical protein